MVGPRSPAVVHRVNVTGNETRRELFERVAIGYQPSLDGVVVEGDGNVPGVSYDIDGHLIARIKSLVARKQAGASHKSKLAVGAHIDRRAARLDVGEGDGLGRGEQVADEKPGPRTAGPRIRHKEPVVGKDSEPTPGGHFAQQNLTRIFEVFE